MFLSETNLVSLSLSQSAWSFDQSCLFGLTWPFINSMQYSCVNPFGWHIIWMAHYLARTSFDWHTIWLTHQLAGTLIGWHTIWLANHLRCQKKIEFSSSLVALGTTTEMVFPLLYNGGKYLRMAVTNCWKASMQRFNKIEKSESLLLKRRSGQSSRDQISTHNMGSVSALFRSDHVATGRQAQWS